MPASRCCDGRSAAVPPPSGVGGPARGSNGAGPPPLREGGGGARGIVRPPAKTGGAPVKELTEGHHQEWSLRLDSKAATVRLVAPQGAARCSGTGESPPPGEGRSRGERGGRP